MSKNIYKLVTVENGKKVISIYRNFYFATDKLIRVGKGKLYQGNTLVGEL